MYAHGKGINAMRLQDRMSQQVLDETFQWKSQISLGEIGILNFFSEKIRQIEVKSALLS